MFCGRTGVLTGMRGIGCTHCRVIGLGGTETGVVSGKSSAAFLAKARALSPCLAISAPPAVTRPSLIISRRLSLALTISRRLRCATTASFSLQLDIADLFDGRTPAKTSTALAEACAIVTFLCQRTRRASVVFAISDEVQLSPFLEIFIYH